MRNGLFSILILALLTGLSTVLQAAEGRVTIFAASSLQTALDEIVQDMSGDVVVAYGGSAAMARQVVQGANADIVLLANSDWMDWAQQQGALIDKSRCDLVSNRLVIAGSAHNGPMEITSVEDILQVLDGGRLAVGNLSSVPAGQYAKEWLEAAGWLSNLRPHLAEVQNVRLALALVARGEAPLGIVYRSDALAEARVKALYLIPQDQHRQIVYPISLTLNASDKAADVFQAITARQDVFAKQGFELLSAQADGSCH